MQPHISQISHSLTPWDKPGHLCVSGDDDLGMMTWASATVSYADRDQDGHRSKTSSGLMSYTSDQVKEHAEELNIK